MKNTVFKRKIYKELLEWKENRSDEAALLIKGARRVKYSYSQFCNLKPQNWL